MPGTHYSVKMTTNKIYECYVAFSNHQTFFQLFIFSDPCVSIFLNLNKPTFWEDTQP